MHLEGLEPVIEVIADEVVDHAELGLLFCLHHVLFFLLELFIDGRLTTAITTAHNLVRIDSFRILIIVVITFLVG